MNTLDAMKQALTVLEANGRNFGFAAQKGLREAIAHEEARAAKPATERDELVRNLREHSDERLYEEADLLMHEAANMLEQDGKELDDVPDELTVAYMQGHSKGVEAGKKQAQQAVGPVAWGRPCKIGGPCIADATSPCACRNAPAPQPPQGEPV